MERTERFYIIQNLLRPGRPVARQVFLDRLEVSPATFKRDLEYLRDRMGAPIVYDHAARGYRLDRSDPMATTFELPGLWFSAAEIHALLTLEYIVENLQPGILSQPLAPLRARIRDILGSGDRNRGDLARRIRIIQTGVRDVEPRHFQTIASALLNRRRVAISHFRRQDGSTLEREVSPQRLVHYRGNWYLDTWCHLRRAIRTFSVDAIETVLLTDRTAREVDERRLDRVTSSGYGIFGGARVETAVLQFTPQRARWVAQESWHPDQHGEYELDGSYVLRVPFSDPRELMMDILKHGADVEVLAPASLRAKVVAELARARGRYDNA